MSLIRKAPTTRLINTYLFVTSTCKSLTYLLNQLLTSTFAFRPESFLFIIGTHSDCISRRRVDVKQICKAASENDAIYLEISNTQLTNINILRKLIAHRISYMLIVRENLINNKVSILTSHTTEHTYWHASCFITN